MHRVQRRRSLCYFCVKYHVKRLFPHFLPDYLAAGDHFADFHFHAQFFHQLPRERVRERFARIGVTAGQCEYFLFAILVAQGEDIVVVENDSGWTDVHGTDVLDV